MINTEQQPALLHHSTHKNPQKAWQIVVWKVEAFFEIATELFVEKSNFELVRLELKKVFSVMFDAKK